MGIKAFFDRWRDRRFAKRVATEELLAIEKTPEFHTLIRAEGPPMMVEREDAGEHGTVTGTYQTVKAMVQEVIDDKKKGRDAAMRITNAIGAPPEPRPRKKR